MIVTPDYVGLRLINDDDHEWLVELHNDPAVLFNLTNPQPITLDQHQEWWNRIKDDPHQLRLIFSVNGERVGLTKFYGIDRSNGNCVLGADIHKDHRGKGWARIMWTLMLNTAFNDLKMYRVSLTTASFNSIGQRVYRSLGFREEGRFTKSLFRDGVYHDQILMYLLREDWLK